MPDRYFPPPWSVEELLTYVYFANDHAVNYSIASLRRRLAIEVNQ
jgi:hypothetical protein